MKKPTFLFKFEKQKNAETFLEKVNKETEGWALNMLKNKEVKPDKNRVLVKGTGSKVFDMRLKVKCLELCDSLEDGVLVG